MKSEKRVRYEFARFFVYDDEAEWPSGYAVDYFDIGSRCLCCVFLLTVLLIIENGSLMSGFL